jgi:hypothetical protein
MNVGQLGLSLSLSGGSILRIDKKLNKTKIRDTYFAKQSNGHICNTAIDYIFW